MTTTADQAAHPPATEDHVLLLDEDGRHIGQMPRALVHSTDTPLHLAFSCYVFGPDGALLLTRRALSKRTWPGVWTNSFCGHPRTDETMLEAIERHAEHELGMTVTGIQLALPDFRYRAVDANGVVENEMCPVYLATVGSEPVPNPDEVMELAWGAPADVGRAIAATPWVFSPWMVKQIHALAELEDAPPSGGER